MNTFVDKVFASQRLAVRRRISLAIATLVTHGRLNRSDIERFGEVSTPQASLDLRLIQKHLPFLMRYDRSLKCYVLADNDCPGHVASRHDPKRCGRCGIHIDELRPSEDEASHG